MKHKIIFALLMTVFFIHNNTCMGESYSSGSSGGSGKVSKSLNVTLVGYYTFLGKANQNGDKAVAKGYSLGADASMMLLKVSQGWGFGPFASYTFTQATNSSSASEKWSARNFQAGIRMLVSSIFVDIGYSTTALILTRNTSSIIGLTKGFVTGGGVTIFDSPLVLRLVVRYSIETVEKNDQITYSSNFNIFSVGAQLGYSF